MAANSSSGTVGEAATKVAYGIQVVGADFVPPLAYQLCAPASKKRPALGLAMVVELVHATHALAAPHVTHLLPFSEAPRWQARVNFVRATRPQPIPVSDLPLEAKVIVTMFLVHSTRAASFDELAESYASWAAGAVGPARGRAGSSGPGAAEAAVESGAAPEAGFAADLAAAHPSACLPETLAGAFFPLGWVAVPVFDSRRGMAQGEVTARLWRDAPGNPLGPLGSNPRLAGALPVVLSFPSFARQVILPHPVVQCCGTRSAETVIEKSFGFNKFFCDSQADAKYF